MTSQYRIERVRFDDDRLHFLHVLTLPHDHTPRWSAGLWWVASQGKNPVAFAGLQPSAQWRDAMYLVRCGVMDRHRGRGLQKRLLIVRENAARRAGARWLVTNTYENPASSNALIARGFRLYEPSVPWGARGTLYWRKKIGDP